MHSSIQPPLHHWRVNNPSCSKRYPQNAGGMPHLWLGLFKNTRARDNWYRLGLNDKTNVVTKKVSPPIRTIAMYYFKDNNLSREIIRQPLKA